MELGLNLTWATLFIVLPVLFLALSLVVWAGNLLVVTIALCWLFFGVLVLPFLQSGHPQGR